MRSYVAILLLGLVLCASVAQACDHKDGKDCEKDHKKKDDHKKHKKWTPIPHYTSVRDCIHKRECWNHPGPKVCGQKGHEKCLFENRCYYACTNFLSGSKWTIKGWGTCDRHPCRNWWCGKW